MKRTVAALLTTTALLASLGAAGDETGFVALFDGRSLAGWKLEGTDRFAVVGGLIVNDGGTGWLRTVKPYKDFEFRAEYRVVKKGSDSGLLFRATAESTPHSLSVGFEAEIARPCGPHGGPNFPCGRDVTPIFMVAGSYR